MFYNYKMELRGVRPTSVTTMQNLPNTEKMVLDGLDSSIIGQANILFVCFVIMVLAVKLKLHKNK